MRRRFGPDIPETLEDACDPAAMAVIVYDMQVVAELAPRGDEAVFDKLAMSAFAGTPLEMALRDVGIRAFAIAGVALEIGIAPDRLARRRSRVDPRGGDRLMRRPGPASHAARA